MLQIVVQSWSAEWDWVDNETRFRKAHPSPKMRGKDLLYAVGVFSLDRDRGSKPEPPKFPSSQLQPRHERIQVDHLAVALEGVMPVQQDVPPGRRRYLGQSSQTQYNSEPD